MSLLAIRASLYFCLCSTGFSVYRRENHHPTYRITVRQSGLLVKNQLLRDAHTWKGVKAKEVGKEPYHLSGRLSGTEKNLNNIIGLRLQDCEPNIKYYSILNSPKIKTLIWFPDLWSQIFDTWDIQTGIKVKPWNQLCIVLPLFTCDLWKIILDI